MWKEQLLVFGSIAVIITTPVMLAMAGDSRHLSFSSFALKK
jgi:hypothetical protein